MCDRSRRDRHPSSPSATDDPGPHRNRVPTPIPTPVMNASAMGLLALALGIMANEPARGADIGPAAEASLETTAGDVVRVVEPRQADLHVIVFLGTECPLAKLYAPRLVAMAEDFSPAGVRFVGISSNRQDSFAKLRRYRREHAIRFPILKDVDQRVAEWCGGSRTPEALLVTSAGEVLYRGRIDDQYRPGVSRAESGERYLRRAIEQTLAGEAVAVPVTDPVGCLIGFPHRRPVRDDAEVTYCRDISPLLREHCVECHRPDEIGPFSLTDYDEIVGWAEMILEVVDERRMPPWHAAETAHALANARGLAEADRRLLHRWVEAGTPYGDPADLPAAVAFTEGWNLPVPPDRVLPMAEEPFVVPATGVVDYQYFVVDPGLRRDRWVRAAEVRPGNRSVVHHCIAFIRPPDGQRVGRFGILAAYVPGQRPGWLPAGYARRLPAGSKIVFQMHYTPIGKVAEDISEVGLVFADADELTHQVYAVGGIRQDFEIPPGASDFAVRGQIGGLPRQGQLLSVMPHMHLRGKSFRLIAERGLQPPDAARPAAEVTRGDDRLTADGVADGVPPSAVTETWLDVPAYDFNWQHNYEYAAPPSLGDVRRLSFEARFDNSSGNPHNPDPAATVVWGDQTWEEMAVVFLDVAEPLDVDATRRSPALGARSPVHGADASVRDSGPTRHPGDAARTGEAGATTAAVRQAAAVRAEAAERRRRSEAFADRYLARFDRDGDGVITPRELPDAVRLFAFSRFDHDGNGRLEREELVREAMRRELPPDVAGDSSP